MAEDAVGRRGHGCHVTLHGWESQVCRGVSSYAIRTKSMFLAFCDVDNGCEFIESWTAKDMMKYERTFALRFNKAAPTGYKITEINN